MVCQDNVQKVIRVDFPNEHHHAFIVQLWDLVTYQRPSKGPAFCSFLAQKIQISQLGILTTTKKLQKNIFQQQKKKRLFFCSGS